MRNFPRQSFRGVRLWNSEKSLAYFDKANRKRACAVLHNFCINAGDEWEWDDGDDDGGNDNDVNVLRDGDDIRELLKEYIAM
ncbi:unnamed protein product [Porites lobata]|uniref:Uncharacterized protein n=1 Tax=Porites lobata TaxID=104759 RepID=A0ABN8PWC2_9CNID|nr:unnamed protein product [Porites lobata]